jgi:hypothetical protein
MTMYLQQGNRAIARVALVTGIVWAIAWPCSVASEVAQGATVTLPNGNQLYSFIVTPEAGEVIRDFHLVSDAKNVKLPSGTELGGPEGWNQGTATSGQGQPAAAHWTAPSGVSLSAPTEAGAPVPTATFTVEIPKPKGSQSWYIVEWVTTKDGQPKVTTGGTVSKGKKGPTTGQGDGLPLVRVSIAGPTTIATASTGLYVIEDHLDPADSTTMTIRVARSLLMEDETRVDPSNPIPQDWGIALTTNSRTGTTLIDSGTISATYFGDVRNHLLIDVPNRPDLVGQTFYVQVDFGNGDGTDVLPVTIGY